MGVRHAAARGVEAACYGGTVPQAGLEQHGCRTSQAARKQDLTRKPTVWQAMALRE